MTARDALREMRAEANWLANGGETVKARNLRNCADAIEAELETVRLGAHIAVEEAKRLREKVARLEGDE
jgi:hypothetical protein